MYRVFLQPEKVPTRNPLLLAIIKCESEFDPFSVRYEEDFDLANSPEKFARMHGITEDTERMLQKMSWGLGHILGCTARDQGFQGPLPRLLEPGINIEFCSKYLLYQLKRYKDAIEPAIAAYNAGTAVKNPDGKFRNQIYVDRVLRELPFYQRLLETGV